MARLLSRGARSLRDWREAKKLTQRDLCKLLGDIDVARLSSFENGRQRPGLPMAVKIQEVTRGVVKAVSWMDMETGKREARAS